MAVKSAREREEKKIGVAEAACKKAAKSNAVALRKKLGLAWLRPMRCCSFP